MTSNERTGVGRGRVILGCFLITIGLWLLLRRLGLDIPGMEQLWPLFPLLLGVALLAGALIGGFREAGLVWPGTVLTLCGAFFLGFTLERWEWWDMAELWPVFLLIFGVSFVATWAAGRFQETAWLVPAGFCLVAGLLSLASTLAFYEEWIWDALRTAWPVALMLIGGALVFRGWRQRAQ